MIRPSVPSDTPILVSIAEGTGVFKPIEIDALTEVLNDYHALNYQHGHKAVTYEDNDKVLGFAYYAPAAMTDRTWYLYWIAVVKETQARGIGAEMLLHAEKEIRKAGGRLFLIETSSLPRYELTRKFYLRHGYEQHALVRDFYSDGDDLVIFRKHLERSGE